MISAGSVARISFAARHAARLCSYSSEPRRTRESEAELPGYGIVAEHDPSQVWQQPSEWTQCPRRSPGCQCVF
jgi:hypothetical protein